MLGRLEMDVDECITAYAKLMEPVFKTKTRWIPINRMGNIKPRFNTARLEGEIKKLLTSRGVEEKQPYNDNAKRDCRV
jgi:hypothetical protein